jgi:two-component system response regulator
MFQTAIDRDTSLRLVQGGQDDAAIRLLVVEDSQDDQELLLRQMRKAGIHDSILFVGDGTKAVELLKQDKLRQIFAVFLDLNLQGAHGIEVLRRIRSLPEIAKIPVIIMTGSTDPRDLEECQRVQISSFVNKPVDYPTFAKAVADIFHLPVFFDANPGTV